MDNRVILNVRHNADTNQPVLIFVEYDVNIAELIVERDAIIIKDTKYFERTIKFDLELIKNLDTISRTCDAHATITRILLNVITRYKEDLCGMMLPSISDEWFNGFTPSIDYFVSEVIKYLQLLDINTPVLKNNINTHQLSFSQYDTTRFRERNISPSITLLINNNHFATISVSKHSHEVIISRVRENEFIDKLCTYIPLASYATLRNKAGLVVRYMIIGAIVNFINQYENTDKVHVNMDTSIFENKDNDFTKFVSDVIRYLADDI